MSSPTQSPSGQKEPSQDNSNTLSIVNVTKNNFNKEEKGEVPSTMETVINIQTESSDGCAFHQLESNINTRNLYETVDFEGQKIGSFDDKTTVHCQDSTLTDGDNKGENVKDSQKSLNYDHQLNDNTLANSDVISTLNNTRPNNQQSSEIILAEEDENKCLSESIIKSAKPSIAIDNLQSDKNTIQLLDEQIVDSSSNIKDTSIVHSQASTLIDGENKGESVKDSQKSPNYNHQLNDKTLANSDDISTLTDTRSNNKPPPEIIIAMEDENKCLSESIIKSAKPSIAIDNLQSDKNTGQLLDEQILDSSININDGSLSTVDERKVVIEKHSFKADIAMEKDGNNSSGVSKTVEDVLKPNNSRESLDDQLSESICGIGDNKVGDFDDKKSCHQQSSEVSDTVEDGSNNTTDYLQANSIETVQCNSNVQPLDKLTSKSQDNIGETLLKTLDKQDGIKCTDVENKVRKSSFSISNTTDLSDSVSQFNNSILQLEEQYNGGDDDMLNATNSLEKTEIRIIQTDLNQDKSYSGTNSAIDNSSITGNTVPLPINKTRPCDYPRQTAGGVITIEPEDVINVDEATVSSKSPVQILDDSDEDASFVTISSNNSVKDFSGSNNLTVKKSKALRPPTGAAIPVVAITMIESETSLWDFNIVDTHDHVNKIFAIAEHSVVHSSDIDVFACNFCGFTSKKLDTMKRHALIHKFFCNHCSFVARQRSNLHLHMLAKHHAVSLIQKKKSAVVSTVESRIQFGEDHTDSNTQSKETSQTLFHKFPKPLIVRPTSPSKVSTPTNITVSEPSDLITQTAKPVPLNNHSPIIRTLRLNLPSPITSAMPSIKEIKTSTVLQPTVNEKEMIIQEISQKQDTKYFCNLCPNSVFDSAAKGIEHAKQCHHSGASKDGQSEPKVLLGEKESIDSQSSLGNAPTGAIINITPKSSAGISILSSPVIDATGEKEPIQSLSQSSLGNASTAPIINITPKSSAGISILSSPVIDITGENEPFNSQSNLGNASTAPIINITPKSNDGISTLSLPVIDITTTALNDHQIDANETTVQPVKKLQIGSATNRKKIEKNGQLIKETNPMIVKETNMSWECFYCDHHSSTQSIVVSHILGKHPGSQVKLKRIVKHKTKQSAGNSGTDNDVEDGGLWSCYYCKSTEDSREKIINHVKFQHPGQKIMITRRSQTNTESDAGEKKEQLVKWLFDILNKGVPGIKWIWKNCMVFELSMKIPVYVSSTRDQGNVYKMWAEHIGLLDEGDKTNRDYAKWKESFLKSIEKLLKGGGYLAHVGSLKEPESLEMFEYYRFRFRNVAELKKWAPDMNFEDMAKFDPLVPWLHNRLHGKKRVQNLEWVDDKKLIFKLPCKTGDKGNMRDLCHRWFESIDKLECPHGPHYYHIVEIILLHALNAAVKAGKLIPRRKKKAESDNFLRFSFEEDQSLLKRRWSSNIDVQGDAVVISDDDNGDVDSISSAAKDITTGNEKVNLNIQIENAVSLSALQVATLPGSQNDCLNQLPTFDEIPDTGDSNAHVVDELSQANALWTGDGYGFIKEPKTRKKNRKRKAKEGEISSVPFKQRLTGNKTTFKSRYPYVKNLGIKNYKKITAAMKSTLIRNLPMEDDFKIETLPQIPDDLKVNLSSLYTYDFTTKIAQCLQCQYSTSSIHGHAHMKEHVMRHTGGRLWGCAYCDHKTNRRATICMHTLFKHPGEERKIIQRRPKKACGKKPTRFTNALWAGPSKKVLGPRCARTKQFLKYSNQFWQCPFCSRRSVFKSTILYHLTFVHPNLDQDAELQRWTRPSWSNNLLKQNHLKSASVKLFSIDEMKKFPVLKDILDTCGKNLYQYLDKDETDIREVVISESMAHNRVQSVEQKVKTDMFWEHTKKEKINKYICKTTRHHCPYCRYTSKRGSILFRHILNSHPDNLKDETVMKDFSFQCNHCTFMSDALSNIQEHIIQEHPSQSEKLNTMSYLSSSPDPKEPFNVEYKRKVLSYSDILNSKEVKFGNKSERNIGWGNLINDESLSVIDKHQAQSLSVIYKHQAQSGFLIENDDHSFLCYYCSYSTSSPQNVKIHEKYAHSEYPAMKAMQFTHDGSFIYDMCERYDCPFITSDIEELNMHYLAKPEHHISAMKPKRNVSDALPKTVSPDPELAIASMAHSPLIVPPTQKKMAPPNLSFSSEVELIRMQCKPLTGDVQCSTSGLPVLYKCRYCTFPMNESLAVMKEHLLTYHIDSPPVVINMKARLQKQKSVIIMCLQLNCSWYSKQLNEYSVHMATHPGIPFHQIETFQKGWRWLDKKKVCISDIQENVPVQVPLQSVDTSNDLLSLATVSSNTANSVPFLDFIPTINHEFTPWKRTKKSDSAHKKKTGRKKKQLHSDDEDDLDYKPNRQPKKKRRSNEKTHTVVSSDINELLLKSCLDNENFANTEQPVKLPHIDDVCHCQSGLPKVPSEDRGYVSPIPGYEYRYKCNFCYNTFSDLTETKVHVIHNHHEPNSTQKFIVINDMYAKYIKKKVRIYLCVNMQCVFLTKIYELMLKHSQCSMDMFQIYTPHLQEQALSNISDKTTKKLCFTVTKNASETSSETDTASLKVAAREVSKKTVDAFNANVFGDVASGNISEEQDIDDIDNVESYSTESDDQEDSGNDTSFSKERYDKKSIWKKGSLDDQYIMYQCDFCMFQTGNVNNVKDHLKVKHCTLEGGFTAMAMQYDKNGEVTMKVSGVQKSKSKTFKQNFFPLLEANEEGNTFFEMKNNAENGSNNPYTAITDSGNGVITLQNLPMQDYLLNVVAEGDVIDDATNDVNSETSDERGTNTIKPQINTDEAAAIEKESSINLDKSTDDDSFINKTSIVIETPEIAQDIYRTPSLYDELEPVELNLYP